MLKRRVVRFSLACLPLVAFSGLGVVCQPKTLPTTATTDISAQSGGDQMQQLVEDEAPLLEDVVVEQETENINEAPVATNAAVEVVAEDEVPAVDVEAQNRDAERVARITQIRDALEAYKKTNTAYPETLEVLVTSAYLSSIPKDIDETDFSYTPIGALPAQYYDLCYTLEVGVGAITSGYHCANPDGVANY